MDFIGWFLGQSAVAVVLALGVGFWLGCLFSRETAKDRQRRRL